MLELPSVVANPAAKPSASAAPAAAAVQATVAPAEAKKGGFAIWVVIGLLVVLVVGAAIGWELFRSRMEELQQGQGGEERLGVSGVPNGVQRERKSRELKPKEEAVVAAPVPEEDDLTGLGKKKKPPPPKQYPPAERAWRAVKADYDKLEARNESTAKKYRMKVLTLEDRKDSASEAQFVKEAGALESQLKDELAKPENQ